MKRDKTLPTRNPEGSALMLSLIFVDMFSALAAAMATLSGVNVQVAENLRQVDTTRSCAESGLEVVRYWANKVEIPGTTAPDQRFGQLAASLQSQLAAAGITNLVPVLSGSTITIANVPLLSSTAQSFSAVLTKIDNDNIQLDVTGHYRSLSRTIRSDYSFGERAHTVFDFGVVSKGPLSLSGNVDLAGVNINVESNAYIESLDSLLALSITGNSSIAGNVKIVNPLANVCLIGGKAGVGGETGQDAMKHIEIGVPGAEFPDMAPGVFASYATNLLSASVDLKHSQTLTNIRIPAGMNPKFTAKTTIKGVLFVEAPNVVEFAGGASITGVIVTNGSQTDDSGTNQLNFTGTVDSYPVTSLPQETQFAGLQSKTGTFIIAPGFAVGFGGNFGTLNGAIAANGVSFSGNAGGTIRGSVINYANTQMTLSGNSDLLFNRSGLDQVPAGFVPDLVLNYDRSSYSEVVL
jgi:hypothetical protein